MPQQADRGTSDSECSTEVADVTLSFPSPSPSPSRTLPFSFSVQVPAGGYFSIFEIATATEVEEGRKPRQADVPDGHASFITPFLLSPLISFPSALPPSPSLTILTGATSLPSHSRQ